MRVAEEQNVGVHFERAVLRAEKSGLHPQRVPVRDEHAVIVQNQHALKRFKAPEIAVAGDLLERQAGEKFTQLLDIAPAVAKMDDALRLYELHRAHHVVDIAVRVG